MLLRKGKEKACIQGLFLHKHAFTVYVVPRVGGGLIIHEFAVSHVELVDRSRHIWVVEEAAVEVKASVECANNFVCSGEVRQTGSEMSVVQ